MRIRWWLLFSMVGLSAMLASQASAQSNNTLWTAPVNLSQSGGASQPLIAVATDGTQHALWWDQTDGERYARASSTDTTWSKSIGVPAILGARRLDVLTGRDVISPPRSPRLIALRSGAVALWIDATDQLSAAQSQNDTWNTATTLSSSAAVFDVARNVSNTLDLAYVKPISSADEPAGIYYRAYGGQSWSNAELVYSSLYFRTATAPNLQISVAGVDQNVLIAWDDPQLDQSQYARSDDGGRTWSAPQIITGTQSARTQRVHVAAAPNGDLLLMWQDASLSGCGWTQRQSRDGGNTWSDAQRVLSSLTRCDERFAFSVADGQSVVSRPREGHGGQQPTS